MKAYQYVDDTFDASLVKRIMRAAVGLGTVSVVPTGVVQAPGWNFALSAISLYLITSAIIGEGIFGLLGRLLDKAVQGEDDLFDCDFNVGGGDRLARAAVAVVVFASIMSGVSVQLGPVDYFLWALVGFYAGMTAILAWDPAYQIIYSSTRHPHAANHAPPPDRLMQSKVGKVAVARDAKAPRAA